MALTGPESQEPFEKIPTRFGRARRAVTRELVRSHVRRKRNVHTSGTSCSHGGFTMPSKVLRQSSLVSAAVAAALLTCMSPTHARVTRIVIDQTLNQPAIGGAQTVAYQTLNGRAFGELCISGCVGAANNTIITDLTLAPQVPSASPATPGAVVVQYVASFSIVNPWTTTTSAGSCGMTYRTAVGGLSSMSRSAVWVTSA